MGRGKSTDVTLTLGDENSTNLDATDAVTEGGGFFARFKKSPPKEENTDSTPSPPKVPFKSLFRFCTSLEKFYIALGLIAAIVHGSLLPIWTIFFGRILESFSTITPENAIARIGDTAKWLLIIGAIAFVCSLIQVRFLVVVSSRTSIRIRKLYFNSLMSQDKAWYDGESTGELTSRVASDVDIIQAGIGDKVGTAAQFISQFIVGFVLAFVYSWRLSLVILAFGPILGICGGIFAKLTAESTEDGTDAYGEAGAIAQETLSLIKTVHAFGGQQEEARRYDSKLNKAFKSGVVKGFANGFGLGLTMFIIFCAYAVAFWYGAKLIREEIIDVENLFVAFFSVLMGAMGLGQAAPAFAAFSAAQGAAPRVFDIIDRESRIDPFSAEGEKPASCAGDIEFQNVTFNYESRATEGAAPVLKNLNLRIEPGSTHALVGPSGCGKSSTMSLIERFYDATDGVVTIDGRDVRQLNVRWLRSQMGYVGQMPTLFRATIRENIAFGAGLEFNGSEQGWHRTEVSLDEIIAAAKKANAHSFIMRLPEQYDTRLGDRGALLSGGQKQRISIARAIVRNPKILLLDEATSALDAQSERIVQEALERAAEGRTTVIIAHRLSTVRNADTISVFKDGVIVEEGTHDQLISNPNGEYKALVDLQQIKAEKVKDGKAEEKDPDAIPLDLGNRPKSFSHASNASVDATSLNGVTKEDNAVPDVDPGIIGRTFKLNAGEWFFILLGCLGAATAGASWPVSALVFSKVTVVLGNPNNSSEVTFWSLMFVVVGVGALLGNLFQLGFLQLSGEKLTRKLRSQSFRALLRQEIGYFDHDENAVGAVTTRLSRDASQVQGLCGGTLGVITMTIGAVATGLVISFSGCWKLALVVLAMLPLMIFAGYFQMKLMTGFDSESKKEFISAGTVATEAVDNINTISPLGIQDEFLDRYNNTLVTPLNNGDKGALVSGVAFGFSELFMFCMWAVAFWVGAVFYDPVTCGFEGIMMAITGLLFAGITLGNTSQFAPDIGAARVSATHIFRLLDRETKIDAELHGNSAPAVQGAFDMKDVKFEYPTRPDVPVLRGMSFSVKPGKTLALVGESGCGKSTVVSLIQRFYDVRTGTIDFDGENLKQMDLQELRSHMAFVQQEPDLFNRTVKENIAYGLPKDGSVVLTDDMIIEAAKAANAHDFIMKLPKQYDTEVGERGGNLSGGQKQRVAVARSMVRNPKILLLDEATSALDAVSEKVVQEALDSARRGRTTIVIAHRLSTVKNADAIAMVERGTVVEFGTHEQLVAKNGKYAALVKHQMSSTADE